MPPSEKTPADEQKIESTKEPLRSRLAYGAEPVDVALSDITVGQSFYINGDESVLLTELDMCPWRTDHRDAMVITITEPYHITDDGKLNLRGMILSVHPGEGLRGTVSDNTHHGAYSSGLTDAMEADARLPRTPKPVSLSIPITGVKLDQSLIARVKPSMMVKYKAGVERFNEYLKEKEIEKLGELPGPVDSVATKKKSEKLATKAAAGKAKSLEDRADNQLLSSTKPPAKTRATKAEMIAKGLDEMLPDLKALNLPKGEYAVTYQSAMAARGLRKTYFTEVITSDSLWETLSKKHKVQEGYNGGHFIDIGPRVTVYGPGHPVRDGVPVEKQLAGAEMIGDIPFVSLGDLHTILLTGTSAKDPNDIKLIDAYQAKTAAKAKKTPGIVKAGTTDAPKVKGLLAGSTDVSGFFPNATAASGSPVPGAKVVSKLPKVKGSKAEIASRLDELLTVLKELDLPKGQYAVTNHAATAARGIQMPSFIEVIVSNSLWETLSKEHGVVINDDDNSQAIEVFNFIRGSFDEVAVSGPGEYLHDAIPVEKQIAGAEMIGGVPFVSLNDLHTVLLTGTTDRNQSDAELIGAYQTKLANKAKKTPGVVKAGTTNAPKAKGPLAGSAKVSGFFPNATAADGSSVPGTKVVSKIPKTTATNPEPVSGVTLFTSAERRKLDLINTKDLKSKRIRTTREVAARQAELLDDWVIEFLIPSARPTDSPVVLVEPATTATVPGTKVVSEIPKATVPAAKPARIGAGFFGKLDDLKALNLPKGEFAVTSSGAMAAHGIREANDVDVVVSPYLWDALSKKHLRTRNTSGGQTILIGNHTKILGPGSHFVDGRIAPMSAQLKGAELIGDVPFVNLRMVSAFKAATGNALDIADVGLIDAHRKRQIDDLRLKAASIKAVHDRPRVELAPSTVETRPAAVIPKTTHVPSTPATSTTVGLKNPAGTASFVFVPKSAQDLRKRKEKALPVVPRKDAPGTVKAGAALSTKNQSLTKINANVVEFFPGVTSLEGVHQQVAADAKRVHGSYNLRAGISDELVEKSKYLSNLHKASELFKTQKDDKLYGSLRKINLPMDEKRDGVVTNILENVGPEIEGYPMSSKEQRINAEIVYRESELELLKKEYSIGFTEISGRLQDDEASVEMQAAVDAKLVVSHGVVESNGQAGLLVSRPASEQELKRGITNSNMLISNMYEVHAETMLSMLETPTEKPGVRIASYLSKHASLGNDETSKFYMSHSTAIHIQGISPGLAGSLFRDSTENNTRDEGTGQGATDSLLGRRSENEMDALRQPTEMDAIVTPQSADREQGKASGAYRQAKRRNQVKTTKTDSAPKESMVGGLARITDIDRQLLDADNYETIALLKQERAEILLEKGVHSLFDHTKTPAHIAVLDKKIKNATTFLQVLNFSKEKAQVQAAAPIEQLLDDVKTVIVNGKEIKLDGIISVGKMSDAGSNVARNTKGGADTALRKAEEYYEAPVVTFDEMLKRVKNPRMVIDGLSPTEFFHKNAKSTPNGILWDEAAIPKLVKAVESPGTLTVSARLIPGVSHSGSVTVDYEFYKSLFMLPSIPHLTRDDKKLTGLYESLSEIDRLREGVITRNNGGKLSEANLEQLKTLERREERNRLEIRGIQDVYARKQIVQLSEYSAPLRKLQEALIQVPELKDMLLVGSKNTSEGGKTKGIYGKGNFDKYIERLGKENPKNLKGIRDIKFAVADISSNYLGGASFDPIELLIKSQKMAFAIKDEMSYHLAMGGYKNGINTYDEAAPEVVDVLEFIRTKKFNINPLNPSEGLRDIVTHVFTHHMKSESIQAETVHRENAEGEGFEVQAVAEERTQEQALKNIALEEEEVRPEFRSAREFFGQVSEAKAQLLPEGATTTFQAAKLVIENLNPDVPADASKESYSKRKGFFFGYKYEPSAGIHMPEALTAEEYNDSESITKLLPNRKTFNEILKLGRSADGVDKLSAMAAKMGILFEPKDLIPIGDKKPNGFYDFQTMLMDNKMVPLGTTGRVIDVDDVSFSHLQMKITKAILRPALLDKLELGKDTPEHVKEIEEYLKDPSEQALPALAKESDTDLKKRLADIDEAEARAAEKRMHDAPTEEIQKVVAEHLHQTGREYLIQHDGGYMRVESREGDPTAVTVDGIVRPFENTTALVPGSRVDVALERGRISQSFSPRIRADEEFSPLRQLVAGENRMIISPELGSAGTHATLEKMLHKMNNGGATIIGFDIETEVEYARDAKGKVLVDEDGKNIIDHSTVLHNVGSTTFTLTPEGVVDKTDGFDVSAAAFTKSKTAEPALGVGSIGHTVGKGHLGSEEENMVSFVFDKFSAADKDAFFGVFNATFDVGRMTDYALDAINARLASIEEAEGKGMFNNSALKEQLDYFQKAHTFFKDEMPGRTVELSHLLEISGVQRTARKRANALEEFLVALGILERGDQVHGGKQDIEDTILGLHKSVSEFTGGKALNLESFSFDGKTADAQQYVFPMHLRHEPEEGKIKARFPKAPFALDGIVQKEIRLPDGKLQTVVAMYGSKIDANNDRIGESRLQGWHYRGSIIQQMATQDTRNTGYFVTDLEHIDEGWEKTRSRENLRELIERNVRRATRYEGRGRGEVNFGRRDQYEAKAAIAQEYEKKLSVSKVAAEAYITDVIKDLTETNESGPHYKRRPELQPLARTSGDGKGTIDTSSAKKAFSFIHTEDAKAIKDWLRSGYTNNFGEAGFLMPHARAAVIETAAVLKEREGNYDAFFMDTFHEAGRAGLVAPEQVRSASAMYRSIMDNSYSKAEREIEGPATATLVSIGQGQQKTTRLNGKMSQEQVYSALFDHSLAASGEVQDVLDATKADYSLNVPTEKEMARRPSTIMAKKVIKARNAKLDPEVVKTMQADPEFIANELSEETAKAVESRHARLDALLVKRIQDDLRFSAPELSGIGLGTQHQSLRSLANEVQQLLSSSDRKVKVEDGLYSGPLFTLSGEAANYENISKTFSDVTGMDLPKDSEGMREWSKNQKNMQELYYAMEKSMGKSAYRTKNYDMGLPQMDTPDDTFLKGALENAEKPKVIRFERKVEYSEAGKAELIANTIKEQYAESIVENEKNALRKAENKLSPMKIGGGLGALALAAFAAETISDMGEAAKDRENDSVVGQPRSTTAHNAGPLDTELNQKGSDSNTAANQGWSRLHINIELEHPGYAGSDKRLDTEALKAFSDDVGSTLSRHFDATPTYTNSQSSTQDGNLRYRVGDMLNRSSGRYR